MSTKKKVGIIQTIFNNINDRPKSEERLLKILTEKFPEKNPQTMANTIKVQIRSKKNLSRMERERNVTFTRNVNEKTGVTTYSIPK